MKKIVLSLFFYCATTIASYGASPQVLREQVAQKEQCGTEQSLIQSLTACLASAKYNSAIFYHKKFIQIAIHGLQEFLSTPGTNNIFTIMPHMTFLQGIDISLNYCALGTEYESLVQTVFASLPQGVPCTLQFLVDKDAGTGDCGMKYILDHIFPLLPNIKNLVSIQFAYIKGSSMGRALAQLSKFVGPSLDSLEIHGCTLNEADLAQLLSFPALRTLQLTDCRLSNIPTILPTLPKLVKVDLSYNDLSQDSFEIITQLADRLHTLSISFCGLTQIPPALNACTMLRKLVFAGNELHETAWESFPNLTLEHLNINYTGITEIPAGVSMFAQNGLKRLDCVQQQNLHAGQGFVFREKNPGTVLYLH